MQTIMNCFPVPPPPLVKSWIRQCRVIQKRLQLKQIKYVWNNALRVIIYHPKSVHLLSFFFSTNVSKTYHYADTNRLIITMMMTTVYSSLFFSVVQDAGISDLYFSLCGATP